MVRALPAGGPAPGSAGEGDQTAIFFELETVAPAAATTRVVEWMRIRGGRIWRVHSAFDGRPFAAMFTGGK